MLNMKEKLSVVKIGGNVIEDEKALDNFLSAFSRLDGLKILLLPWFMGD